MAPGKNTAYDRRAREAAVAIVECRSLDDAAARCGISQRSLRRWLGEKPEFQELVAEASRAAYRHAQGRMRSLCSKACRTLDAAMDRDGASSVMVRAATTVLDFSAKADLAELEQRLTVLEQAQT